MPHGEEWGFIGTTGVPANFVYPFRGNFSYPFPFPLLFVIKKEKKERNQKKKEKMKKNQKKNDVFFEKEGKKEEKGAFQGQRKIKKTSSTMKVNKVFSFFES